MFLKIKFESLIFLNGIFGKQIVKQDILNKSYIFHEVQVTATIVSLSWLLLAQILADLVDGKCDFLNLNNLQL